MNEFGKHIAKRIGEGVMPKLRSLTVLAAILGASLSAGAAWSANLTDVSFVPRNAGSFEVHMRFDGPPPQAKAYAVERPARIAVDLHGVSSQLPRKKYPLAYDNATAAHFLEAGDRTRMVLNLIQIAPYDTRIEGSTLIVSVGNSGTDDYLKQSNVATALANVSKNKPDTGKDASIADLDFRRGDKGEGRLIIRLNDSELASNVYVEGSRINVEFEGGSLPQQLQRRYDVTDFATPVQLVDVTADERGAKFSIQAAGDYDYLAYQADGEYVVSVKPLTQREIEAKKREFAYVGEKLSLNFQNIEVRSVLQIIADFTELNLVASDTVGGNITLRLKDVPWDQALDLVLKTKGLDKRQVGNVLMVAPAAEIAQREREQIEAQKQVEELAPLQTEYIRVRYADAGEIFKLFKPPKTLEEQDNATASILSPRGSVIVDDRTNSLLVTETAEKLEQFRDIVRLIDVPRRQVQIESRIVQASTGFDEALGVRWGGSYAKDRIVANSDIANNAANISSLAEYNNELAQAAASGGDPSSVSPPEITNGLISDLGVAGPTGSLAIGFIGNNGFLDLELSALESQGGGEVVAQPKIITGDKEPGIIKSGTEIPYQEAGGDGTTTIAFKEAVLKLEVTPTITPDDRVMMELVISQDSVGAPVQTGQGTQLPTIDTTELQTRVLVGNGETIVLGGVYSTLDTRAVSKVPILGDIPYIGRMFKRTTRTEERRETLIFITPKILADSLVD